MASMGCRVIQARVCRPILSLVRTVAAGSGIRQKPEADGLHGTASILAQGVQARLEHRLGTAAAGSGTQQRGAFGWAAHCTRAGQGPPRASSWDSCSWFRKTTA